MNLNLISFFYPDPLTQPSRLIAMCCTSPCARFVVYSQDLVTTIKNPVLCLVVLRLAVVFLEEVWEIIPRNP